MTTSIWALAKQRTPADDSVVDFPTKTRFHIALNVKNVGKVIDFYTTLFGESPHTTREGYAKYDLAEPPLNISLNEVPKNAKGDGRFGIQIKTVEQLYNVESRLKSKGYKIYTIKSKNNLIAKDPEGNEWRISHLTP